MGDYEKGKVGDVVKPLGTRLRSRGKEEWK